jgi:hypothetical protein
MITSSVFRRDGRLLSVYKTKGKMLAVGEIDGRVHVLNQ